MRKKIIKLSTTSVGITLSPVFLELLGIENPKEAHKYTLDVSFKDNSLILKDPIKTKDDEEE